MGYFLPWIFWLIFWLVSWSSPTKEDAEHNLNFSEVMLVICGLLLAFGAIGEYLEEHNKLPRWMRWPKLVFIVLVASSLVGEFLGDAGVFVSSKKLQEIEGAEIHALDIKANLARTNANDAIGKSQTAIKRSGSADTAAKAAVDKSSTAEKSAFNALSLAKGARQEADSFEKDIKDAKRDALEAKALLADARQLAAEAQAGVMRIHSSRTLRDKAAMSTKLAEFKDTEYTFSSVCADKECDDLLKLVDGVLQTAEWRRIKPVFINGTPAINVFGASIDFSVPVSLSPGIGISIDSRVGLSALQALPENMMPLLVRAAVALRGEIISNLLPHAAQEDVGMIDVAEGDSKTIRIGIGRKPL
jgi:hypothetical protein